MIHRAMIGLASALLGCGEDLPPPTPDGTTVLEWTRPASGTGSITVAEAAGDPVTDVYEVRLTPDPSGPAGPEVREATFEVTVERRPHHVRGHQADPVWVPESVRVVLVQSGRWNAGTVDGRPASCEFSTDAVHAHAEVRYHIPVRCVVPLHRGSHSAGTNLIVGGGPGLDATALAGTARVTPRPRP